MGRRRPAPTTPTTTAPSSSSTPPSAIPSPPTATAPIVSSPWTTSRQGVAYYHFDALGSITNLTDPTGAVQNRYQYDAWGNHRTQSGTQWNPFGFTGHEYDEETGLYYAKARFYDPEVGRFLTEDPAEPDLTTPPSLHRYLYAYGNPTYYTDPDGRTSAILQEEIESERQWVESLSPEEQEAWERTKQDSIEGLAKDIVGGAKGYGRTILNLGIGLVEMAGDVVLTITPYTDPYGLHDQAGARTKARVSAFGHPVRTANAFWSLQKQRLDVVLILENQGNELEAAAVAAEWGSDWALVVLGTVESGATVVRLSKQVTSFSELSKLNFGELGPEVMAQVADDFDFRVPKNTVPDGRVESPTGTRVDLDANGQRIAVEYEISTMGERGSGYRSVEVRAREPPRTHSVGAGRSRGQRRRRWRPKRHRTESNGKPLKRQEV